MISNEGKLEPISWETSKRSLVRHRGQYADCLTEQPHSSIRGG